MMHHQEDTENAAGAAERHTREQVIVHLNAAGAALRSRATTDAMLEFLEMESKVGAYEMASAYGKDLIARPYRELATLLGCAPEEISLVSSATEAWNEVIHGLAWTVFSEGAGIVTSITEYGSNYMTYLQLRKRFKIRLHIVDETREGDIDVDALERLIQNNENNIVLISLPHVPTNSGRVYDVARVGEVARRHKVLFLLDACQSVGQMQVDVGTIGCDFLTGTSRKWLRGPRGVGFVYCSRRRRELFEPASIDVHSAVLDSIDTYTIDRGSRMFEKYERCFVSICGFGVAVAELNQIGVDTVARRVQELACILRKGLREIEGLRVEDKGARLCGIVSFSVEGRDGETAKVRTERLFESLVAARFSISISRKTSTLLDMSRRGVECVIRASPHV